MNCGGHVCRSLLVSVPFSAAEITTTIGNIAIEVPLGSKEGLSKQCVADLDNLRTVAREWLLERIGSLVSARHVEVKGTLGYALAWDELIDLDQ
jgi:mRNA-degrading endonuclease toxin of MazEF toxin-antitoxin module